MLDFLRFVLPETGAYFISTIHPVDKQCSNRAFTDLTAAVAYAQSAVEYTNVYFAVSAYDYIHGAIRRKQEYAVAQKALWLDLDCDSEKALRGEAYASQADAVKALQCFLSVTGLPMPTVVNSGNGFHLYWVFTTAVNTAQWKQMATLLRKVCIKHHLIVDHHRTRDVASILRVPGSVNHKDGNRKPVTLAIRQPMLYDVVEFAGKLIALTDNAPTVSPFSPAPVGEFAFSDSFTSKAPKESIPRSASRMIEQCRQIREMATSSYPAWMLAARTLVHTTDGEQLIHDLSKQDSTQYDSYATQKLIDNLKTRMDVGPGTCESFSALCPEKCASCPFRGKVKTPWSLCAPAHVESVTMPAVSLDQTDLTQAEIALGDANDTIKVKPFHDDVWSVVPGKGVCKVVYDDDGVPQTFLVSKIEVYIHTLCIDSTHGGMPKRTYIMRKVAPDCAPVDIPFSVEDALGSQKIEAWVAQCGMLPHPKYKKAFFEFMSTYIAAVQNKLPEVYVRNHLGWEKWTDKSTGKTYNGFILGDRMITEAGNKPVKLDDRASSVATKLCVRGSIADWKRVPQLYDTLDQKFAQLLMCTAFGAPLMKLGLGTATNVAYNFWDINGGKGKSSVLKAVASVWGDPQQLLMGRTDTHAARFQQYAVYRNLPILIDEITGIHDDDAASMLYDIVNGREKARSNSSGTGLAASGSWDTITIFTANQSMYEQLKDYRAQTSATCMRLIEYKCDFQDYTGTDMAQEINSAMSAARENYGLAGPLFIDFVVRHPQVVDRIVDGAERFATKHAASSDERFWLYGIAIPLYAGVVAKAMGLLPYDMDALEDYCVNTLLPSLRSRVKVNAPTGGNLLTDFLNASLRDTLIVRAATRAKFMAWKERTNFKPTSVTLDPYIVQLPVNSLTTRREVDSGILYVSSTALNAWCKKQGVSVDALLTDLSAQGKAPWGIKPVRRVLGKDVDMLMQSTQCVYKFLMPVENSDE